jgi:glyoxylase-like metal-dependent hydrolase (beta-lactamase superfamily II)
MEIAPGVHRIECRFDKNRMAYVHLFVGTEAVMIVDTCCAHNPEQDILPYMQSIGVEPYQLKYIITSHSDLDHQGGNRPMKEAAPRAILMCHNLDRPWIENTDALIEGRYAQFDKDHGFQMSEDEKEGIRKVTASYPVDMTLEGGETVRLSPEWYVQVIHTPGHTWGHLAIFDSRSKTLVAGEAGLWNAILDLDFKPALPPTYCYVDTYLATLDRLMAMDIDNYSPAHWPLQRGTEVAEFLRESRNYCLHVEQKLLKLAAEHRAFTLKSAIERLAPELGSWPESANSALTFPLAGNLHRLAHRRQLNQAYNRESIITWSLPE